jgi:hypothetical protein
VDAVVTPDETAAQVLIAHQRRDIGSCRCGWGEATGDLGRSHAAHIIDRLHAAGLLITAGVGEDTHTVQTLRALIRTHPPGQVPTVPLADLARILGEPTP